MEAKALFRLNIPLDIKESIYKCLWSKIYKIDPLLKKDIESFAMFDECVDVYARKYNNILTPLQYMDVMLYDMCIQVHHDSDDDITYMLAYYFHEDDHNVHITLVNDVDPENKYPLLREKWRRMTPEERRTFASGLLGKN